MSKIDKPVHPLNPAGMRIVLVLQGGGALGAYQAGVFQALHEHQLAPDWVVGTSIGAINAAILAGNRPEDRLVRLKQFWQRIAHRDSIDLNFLSDQQRRSNSWLSTFDTLLRGVRVFQATSFQPVCDRPGRAARRSELLRHQRAGRHAR